MGPHILPCNYTDFMQKNRYTQLVSLSCRGSLQLGLGWGRWGRILQVQDRMLPLMNTLVFCSSWIFCIHFDFFNILKYVFDYYIFWLLLKFCNWEVNHSPLPSPPALGSLLPLGILSLGSAAGLWDRMNTAHLMGHYRVPRKWTFTWIWIIPHQQDRVLLQWLLLPLCLCHHSHLDESKFPTPTPILMLIQRPKGTLLLMIHLFLEPATSHTWVAMKTRDRGWKGDRTTPMCFHTH